ncbi:MAG: alanine:cation symporter family protein [Gammaproteobacteria bacterium]|nr:alanine:cation symporter family protein [Gammaproteobacteria bacterium]NNF60318.1 alanine:cation symporter family protein [Gammaproteobacteria bacterium]NNM20638.1 alanine:cation symporter family protein [Gammaproteobacteria bacterium]
MEQFNAILAAIGSVLWHEYVLYLLLLTGVVLTFWSGFCQYRALTHGTKVLRGVYDDPDDPGAINHFQALSAALSATVGLGNIGGVALAIALGGPGAVFWMWVVGFFGMSIKLTEVTLSMIYRNTDDPDNPHGGPMWVVDKGLKRLKPELAGLGRALGVIFCCTLLVSTVTGGNMFQAWNVAGLTETYFGVPGVATGIFLAAIVAMVIIGGIKRIGAVAGRLVPLMVGMYLTAGIYVLILHAGAIPETLALIVRSAFSSTEATGAFLGGTAGYAFLFGMKRALFSNEAGQGSSPIAHSAAKTDEPVREAVVAGLEPFIDTLVVCTFTALIILVTGVWNRGAEGQFITPPAIVPVEAGQWSIEETELPKRSVGEWIEGEDIFMLIQGDDNANTGNNLHRINGTVLAGADGSMIASWRDHASTTRPRLHENGVYADYVGAPLTARAFDSVVDGLGKWLVTIAAWLFAISTMISWSYYGEQGIVYLFGERAVLAYKVVFCMLIVVATLGIVTTSEELDNLSSLGTGVMLVVNVPILWIFGYQAMRAYKHYIHRLKNDQLGPEHEAPSIEDIITGRDLKK